MTTKLLLKAGSDLDAKTTRSGCTLLNLAAEEGRTEVVSVLIEAEADPNSISADSSTRLRCKRRCGCSRPCRLKPVVDDGAHGYSDQRRSDRHRRSAEHGRRVWPRFGGEVSIAAAGKLAVQELAIPEPPRPFRRNALVWWYSGCHPSSPRITWLLVDAEADNTTRVRVVKKRRAVIFHGTPLAFTNFTIRDKKIGGKDATEEQLYTPWRLNVAC